MRLDASATRLVKLLALQAQASAQALRAAVAGDEAATRSAVDALRVLRAKLQTLPEQARAQLDQLPPQAQAAIQSDLEHIQRANNFVPVWCHRYAGIASYEQLCASDAGIDALIDQALPLAWDFDKDIIVLVASEELAFVQALVARGQKRIVFAAQGASDTPCAGLAAVFADSKEKLRRYFQEIVQPYPVRITGIKPAQTPAELEVWADVKHLFTLFLTNQKTSRTFGNIWLSQGLQNLPAIADSAHLSALGTALQGLPVVIIAPGPSLDKNIALLQQLKGRAVLMAAAQCARALSQAGITPDFLVVIDPGDLVYFLDGVDTGEIDALMVGVSCNPGFFAKPFKNRIVFNANAHADQWISNLFQETLPLSSAGSVSVASVHIAKYLNCGPILLVGQDLALSGGKQYSSHSANSASTPVFDVDGHTLTFSNVSADQEKIFQATGTSSQDTIEPVLQLPGYYGGLVSTRRNYHLFHGEFVAFARQENAQPAPRPLLNCTEGGAFIEGFRHISLAQAIKEYIPASDAGISARIRACCAQSDTAGRRLTIHRKLRTMQRDLEEAIHLAKQCLHTVSHQAVSKSGHANLDRLEKKLVKCIERIPALALPNQHEIQQALSLSSDATTTQESNGAATILYQSIVNTGTEILPLLIASLEKCRSPAAEPALV